MFSRLSTTLVALFSLVAVVVAVPTGVSELRGIQRRDTGRMCGNEPTPEVVTEMENAFDSIVAQSPGTDTSSAGSYTVQVFFNVIYASEDISDGYIP